MFQSVNVWTGKESKMYEDKHDLRTRETKEQKLTLQTHSSQDLGVHDQISQYMRSELDDWWPVLWHWNNALALARKRKTITALSKHKSPRLQEPTCQVPGLCENPGCCGGNDRQQPLAWQHCLAWHLCERELDEITNGGRGCLVIRIAMIRSHWRANAPSPWMTWEQGQQTTGERPWADTCGPALPEPVDRQRGAAWNLQQESKKWWRDHWDQGDEMPNGTQNPYANERWEQNQESKGASKELTPSLSKNPHGGRPWQRTMRKG
jgi:hypothetical protein